MRLIKLLAVCSFVILSLIGAADRLPPNATVLGQTGAILSSPTGVAASDGSYTLKVGLTWDAIRNATAYRVFRNTSNDAASAITLGTTAAAAFFDTTALPGQTYFYWVRAENGDLVSSLSASDQGFRAGGVGNQPSPPPPLAPAGNPLTAAKAFLGKTLFWDEQLSATRTVACGTCHHGANGGADPRAMIAPARSTNPGSDGIFGTADDVVGSTGVPQNLADGSYQWTTAYGLTEQVTGRRSLSYINAGYSNSLFWDGRALQVFKDPITAAVVLDSGAALESQVLGPPVNSAEMGHVGRDWNDVASRVVASTPLALSPTVPAALSAWIDGRGYPELFTEAFGTPDVTPDRIAMAIATFERTLYSDRAPIDVGDLTASEARGQQVFNQSRCNVCHASNLFTDNQFHNTGVRPSAEDTGRFAVTGDQNDMGRFRTPSLRDVQLRAPYMHNGRFDTLEAVIEFYNRGGDFNPPNLERNLIRPLNLNTQQKADLAGFLKRPLTDARVANETAPFDRPTLYSESARVPRVFGTGAAGSNGVAPQVVALEPPIAGNPRFTVGVYDALGGAHATLVINRTDPGVSGGVPATGSFARLSVQLLGSGGGQGYGSATMAIPSDSSLIGATLFGRWYVNDPGAAGGVAVTPVFQITVFGTSPVAGSGVEISDLSVSAKNLFVSGKGFEKGDVVEINGIQANAKFVDSNTLNVKKGAKLLLGCAASPGGQNVITLIRTVSGAPVTLVSKTLASCP